MTEKTYTCIVCPVSCRVTVQDENGNITVEGNTCKRGEDFARAEHTNPMRMLTTTVKIEKGCVPRLPVISSAELPKNRLEECLAVLYKTVVQAPVSYGDVILADICGTGVDIVASRTVQ